MHAAHKTCGFLEGAEAKWENCCCWPSGGQATLGRILQASIVERECHALMDESRDFFNGRPVQVMRLSGAGQRMGVDKVDKSDGV